MTVTEMMEEQPSYCAEELHGCQSVGFLCDKPRVSGPSKKMATLQTHIDRPLYSRLRRFCSARQLTLLATLLTTFRLAHYRLTESSDAIIGKSLVSQHGRDQEECEGYAGQLKKLEFIRIRVEQDESFEDLVRRVEACPHIALASEEGRLWSSVPEKSDMVHNHLGRLALELYSTDPGYTNVADSASMRANLSTTAQFEVKLEFYQNEDTLRGQVFYDPDLFHPRTMDSMLSVFHSVLAQGLECPSAAASQLEITGGYLSLDAMGLAQINATAYPMDSSIIQVFKQQAALSPNSLAVKDERKAMSYNELDGRSSDLAHWLRHYAFPSETPVGLLARRSCDAVVAFLAILKANLACIPFDVRQPIDRLQTILSSCPECQIVFLGCDVEVPHLHLPGVQFMRIKDAILQRVDSAPCPAIQPSPRSLAYIIFTSGSTGKPKGVMIEHRGVVRLTKQTNYLSQSTAAQPSAHMASLAFDCAICEIFLTLLNGGTLVCIDDMTVLDPSALGDVFHREHVKVAQFTPLLLRETLKSSPCTISHLETLIVAGDRLDPDDVIHARAYCRGAIINAYGPTENSVCSTFYPIPADEMFLNGVPIGRSITNSGAYVMDQQLRLVPVGVIGELVVTGDGLARGYTEPHLDEGRFVQVNIGREMVRAYRTGDFARFRPADGQLECFGRMDGQVKIRGQRVELGEIEQALLSYSFVEDAVTVIQEAGHQNGALVSFVTIEEGCVAKHAKTQNAEGRLEDRIDLLYTDNFDSDQIGRDFQGWTSMYDQSAIDRTDMVEWLDDTIDTILNTGQPGRVLEVGTGSGMILFNLAPHFQQYMGIEPYEKSVNFVSKAVQTVVGLVDKVQMRVGTATDVGEITGFNPDLAVINSVAQYFPSAEYLLKLVEDLVRVQGVKRIFFGDIRSHALYSQFQVSMALHRGKGTVDRRRLRQHITQAVRMEEELLADPAFFTVLPSIMPDLIKHVEILPKRMNATNELSCYRYAAVLHSVHEENRQLNVIDVPDNKWIDFVAANMDRAKLVGLLLRPVDSTCVAISNIPNSKTILERLIVDSLGNTTHEKDEGASWIESLRHTAAGFPALSAADIEAIATQTGWRVEISWARQSSQHGGLDAIFHLEQPAGARQGRTLFRFPSDPETQASKTLTTHPHQQRIRRLIEKELQQSLRKRLPSYMVPVAIRVLDRMPHNKSHKVDRQALKERNDVLISFSTTPSKAAPRTALERTLSEELVGLLQVNISITDSFFELGGNSLTAIKLVANINSRLGTSLRVGDIFSCPTIVSLVERIEADDGAERPEKLTIPFSLVQNELSSLTSLNYTKMGLTSIKDAVDILPATNLQRWFLTQWTRTSMSYSIRGEIHVERLHDACKLVVQRHSSLRTAFFKHQEQYMQIIHRATDVEFVHKCPGESLESTADLISEEYMSLSQLSGQPLPRFLLLSRSATEHRLLVQLSHAQYDGFSFPLLLSEISSFYSNPSLSLPPASQYSDFIYAREQSRTQEAFNFWKEYLRGASLTMLSPRAEAGEDIPTPVTAIAVGELPASLLGVTFSTLVNVAFAFMLAEMVNSNELTFGLAMNIRDIAVKDAGSIMGPCINWNPIRVHIKPYQTVLDVCRHFHEEYAGVSRYSSLDLPDIVANCTDWQADSGFGVIINHLTRGTDCPLKLQGTETASLGFGARLHLPSQVLVRAIVVEDTKLEIQVLTSDRMMSSESAMAFAARLLRTVKLFSDSPHKPLRSLQYSELN